jgi:bacterioferritin-associated ferredoxin
MFVCLCVGVRDSNIKECIKNGAKSVDAVAFETGAGTVCGGCRPLIETMVGDNEKGQLKEGAYDYNDIRRQ